MLTSASTLASQAEEALLRRNAPFEEFFRHESMRLAAACRDMSDRFLQGGRLLAFGGELMPPMRSMFRSSLFIPL